MDVLGEYWQIWMLVLWLAPLVGFALQISFGKYLPRKGDWLCVSTVGASFAISISSFISMFRIADPDFQLTAAYSWIPVMFSEGGHPALKMGFLVDNVTIIMLTVVTGVSLLVHIYSIGYMHGDEKYSRFFSFLNLFTFSMLGLVLVDNLLGLYIFWELVGLSSYLLIGFWYEKENLDPARASIKAFLTTRVGDIGMFIGILLITVHLGAYQYPELFRAVAAGGASGGFGGHSILGYSFSGYQVWTLSGVMVFMGAVGKSAQFPLHIWLPDAMEGPTPVSALIHAATMVAAGVYMVTRLFVFFSPTALFVIALFGGVTAFFAATMALVDNDIKGVLAYSTISQLGYMVLALGLGGWIAGFYHLFTHAFFKALLFLCAGSVIHAVHTNNMHKMGGLWKKMPWTFGTMLLATFSIAGIPLFSGFLTKELILVETLKTYFSGGGGVQFLFPLFGFGAAILTVFYMFRLIFLTFSGTPSDEEAYEHAHESPWSMVVPMVIIASLTFFWTAGAHPKSTDYLWFGSVLKKPSVEQYKTGSNADLHGKKTAKSSDHSTSKKKSHAGDDNDRGQSHKKDHGAATSTSSHGQEGSHAEKGHGGGHGAHNAHKMTLWLSISAVILGIVLASAGYWERFQLYNPGTIAGAFSPLHTLLRKGYYMNELMFYGLVIPGIKCARFLAGKIDLKFIDAIVDEVGELWVGTSLFSGWFDGNIVDRIAVGTAERIGQIGNRVRQIQTGNIRLYLGLIGGGILSLLGVLLVIFRSAFIRNWMEQFFSSAHAPGELVTSILIVGFVFLIMIRYWRSILKWIRFSFTGK